MQAGSLQVPNRGLLPRLRPDSHLRPSKRCSEEARWSSFTPTIHQIDDTRNTLGLSQGPHGHTPSTRSRGQWFPPTRVLRPGSGRKGEAAGVVLVPRHGIGVATLAPVQPSGRLQP